MAIQNDTEAQATVAKLLSVEARNPNNPIWLQVIDLCFYCKKRLVGSTEPLPKPKPNRTAYWRQYKRDWRAKHPNG